MLSSPSVHAVLNAYYCPQLELCWGDIDLDWRVTIQSDGLQVVGMLRFPLSSAYQRTLLASLKQYLASALSMREDTITVQMQTNVTVAPVQSHLQPVSEVRNVIAIASAKGGVGKSTLAINIAASLQQMGCRVGVLDADIYGPSQPHMLYGPSAEAGLSLEVTAARKWCPRVVHGMQSMSIGYLLKQASIPTIWRGPMASKALCQLFENTLWHDLDYLIVDLPPGTGDIQLTLAQKIPLAGVVMVTTPQAIAVLDARKGLEMFGKVAIPVLGVVENMSPYMCTHCGHSEPIFSEEGGAELAKQTATRFLGSVPLHSMVRVCADQGKPIVISDVQHAISKKYTTIAQRMVTQLSLK